jgi:flavin reductase (DIM6/NTAB) family NADH-FMN oxidoreductase RutF
MKKDIGTINCLYPMPVTLVGTIAHGKANFMVCAHVGIMNFADKNYISVSIGKMHETNHAIHENGTFSVNIPSEDMVVETDYAGIVTGKDMDKSGLFPVTFGKLESAPMIESCPVSMECRVYSTVEFPSHDVFIGEIVTSWCDENGLTNGAVDLAKTKPMLFDMALKQYWNLGKPFAKCWAVGNQYSTEKPGR